MEIMIVDAVKERLSLEGYKLTAPRLAIISYMAGVKGHPAMQDIYEGMQAEAPGIGMATVYRTIDLLQKLGVLRVLNLRKHPLRYELKRPGDHHHHLVCNACGQVMEFGSCNFQSIAEEIEKVTRFKIEEHALEAYGYCPQCKPGSLNYSAEKM